MNGIRLGGVLSGSGIIVGGGEVNIIGKRGGPEGSGAGDRTFFEGFEGEGKGIEVSGHYVCYTLGFHVLFDSHIELFGILHHTIFGLLILILGQKTTRAIQRRQD